MGFPHQELIKGIAVSPGIVCAPAFVVGDAAHLRVARRSISDPEVGAEPAKPEAARHETEETLRALCADVSATTGVSEARVFDAQLQLLIDLAFLNEVSTHVATHRLNLETALADGIVEAGTPATALPPAALRFGATAIST